MDGPESSTPELDSVAADAPADEQAPEEVADAEPVSEPKADASPGPEQPPETNQDADPVSALAADLLSKYPRKQDSATLPPQQPPDQTPAEPEKFLDAAEYEAVLSSPEGLQKFAERIAAATEKRVLRQLPKLVQNNISQETVARENVAKFFRNNQDLDGYRDLVSAVDQWVMNHCGPMSLDDYHKCVADLSRAQLDKQTSEWSKKRGGLNPGVNKVALAPAPGARIPQPKPKLQGIEDDLETLGKHLGESL
jgi:hypothetical protein